MSKRGLVDYQNSVKTTLSNELQDIICEKAYKFDVKYFQNEHLASALCDLSILPNEVSTNAKMGEFLGWVMDSYSLAQLSLDKK